MRGRSGGKHRGQNSLSADMVWCISDGGIASDLMRAIKFKVLVGGILGIERVHLDNPSYEFQEFYLYVVVFLPYSLESVSTTCKQLSQELMEKYEELKRMEGHNNEYRTEIKKVRACVCAGLRAGRAVLSEGNEVRDARWSVEELGRSCEEKLLRGQGG